ncbi:uncharacterized protein LOC111324019 isoform X2 [Stylophora pistillata]|uniref:uncharacterized protein LOC111324019 isoform X2 n=1 Tax=Stylophora pistillata TaxID=50429 RepID=UPI000C05267F|nr:uncharacterized protein LOC111324019 isoform X2 [Stylophora pistillata]
MFKAIKPSRCGCGEAVAFNVPSLARHMRVNGIDPVITDATIRHFITSKVVGCVGKSNKFWSRTTSSTSAHISRRYLAGEILGELDKGTDKGETSSTSDFQVESQTGKDTGETSSSSDIQGDVSINRC